ncbi:hypothetical protein LTR66_014374, partial [Elasticomyces elasticus]
MEVLLAEHLETLLDSVTSQHNNLRQRLLSHKDADIEALNTELTALRSRAARLEEVEVENERLRTRLADLLQGEGRGPGRDSDSTLHRADATAQDVVPYASSPVAVTWDDFADLKIKYEQLRQNNNTLERECRDRAAQLIKANEKLQAAKRNAKEWQRYVDRNPKNRKSAEQPPHVIASTERSAEPAVPSPQDAVSRTEHPVRMTSSFTGVSGHNPEITNVPSRSASSRHEQEGPKQGVSPRITSSQTTDSVADTVAAPARSSDSDNLPVFVSSKSLRRKGYQEQSRPANMFQNRNDGTPVRPINIKDEPLSSPPVASHNTAHLLRTETSDLDAIRTAMDTPRKRHRLDTLLKKSQHEAAQSFASRQSRSKRLAGLPSPSRTENQDPGTQSQHGFRIDMEAAEDLRATSEPLTVPVKQQSQRSGGVLQPLSINTPTLPRASAVTRAGRKGKQGRSASRIGFLTEDGEPTSDVPHATRSKGPVAKAETHQRLHTLLNQRFTDDRQPLTVRRTPVTAKKRARETKPDAEPASERPARRAKREGSPLPARTPEPINPSHTPPGPIEPEDEPLRARPLHRLTLDDFRVNPASNQNQDYAYTETIRGRDQRRCLPGCTKP